MLALSPLCPSLIRSITQGVRGFWLTENFDLETHLLAIKEFKPGEGVSDERASTVVRLWTWQVLEENGLEPSDVIAVVCDGDSDVKCAFNNVDGVFFEWCICHQLNRAIIEGFGLSAAPAQSKNTEARAVIYNMKKDVDHINQSEPAKVRNGSTRCALFCCFRCFSSAVTLGFGSSRFEFYSVTENFAQTDFLFNYRDPAGWLSLHARTHCCC